jgi:hypothetical protein
VTYTLTLMGPCIVIIIAIYIQRDATLHGLLYLETAVHVSGGTITHLQEHKTTVTTASGICYTVMDRVKFTDKLYVKI